MQGTPVQGEFGVWPDTLARWVAGETWYAPAGMESFDQIRDRVLPVWDRVTLENQGKTLVDRRARDRRPRDPVERGRGV